MMKADRVSLSRIVLALLCARIILATANVAATPAIPFTRQLVLEETTAFPSPSAGSDVAIQGPELPDIEGDIPGAFVNRSYSPRQALQGIPVDSAAAPNLAPRLVTSFNGLNHFQQRFANGGNQLSLEPPDQGLCVGNGFVMESVNEVLRVYNTAGQALSGVVDLNTFYGYPARFNCTTGKGGPAVFDPSCYFDPDTQRWFQVALTLEVNPDTRKLTGPNHLDIAVSTSASPLGTWKIYRLPVQNDGTDGTPAHHCSFGPCFGDYPHIGADASGFYITTNEYSRLGRLFAVLGRCNRNSLLKPRVDRNGLGESSPDFANRLVHLPLTFQVVSEYIAQTCTLAQYVSSTPFTCGGSGTVGPTGPHVSLRCTLNAFVTARGDVPLRAQLEKIPELLRLRSRGRHKPGGNSWRALYNRAVFDLGAVGNESLRGIFSPIYDPQVVSQYVHAQFSEAAQIYAEKYAAVEHFTWLLSRAFAQIGWGKEEHSGLTILDIGSGAGNSIFPLLELCPESLIIASDLSIELLVWLKKALAERGLERSCVLLQLNAEELDFIPESFDLVVGAAVLHHLFSPEKTIAGCARILKRGGYALFFEPFEAGHAILRLIYSAILQDARHQVLSAEVAALLQSLI